MLKRSWIKRGKSVLKRIPIRQKSKSERSILISQCDDIFRDIIRKRDKVCQKTGRDFDLDCAHFISRSNLHLRWDLDNACLLQKGIHYYWAHIKHQQFRQFWVDRIGLEKVEKLEFQDRVKCRTLWTCELRIIKRCLLDILNKYGIL